MRKTPLVTGEIYHIFNRGVNKQNIFFEKSDYYHFYNAAAHYKDKSSKFSSILSDPVSELGDENDNGKQRVEVVAYCFMPNHFHFLMKQLEDEGIVSYMRRLCNSHSHYINRKHDRVGPLYQGRYKNLWVKTTKQLNHISRYIHLNPLVSNLVSNLKEYRWSSYNTFINGLEDKLCVPDIIINGFNTKAKYDNFVRNQEEYARSLARMKHLKGF